MSRVPAPHHGGPAPAPAGQVHRDPVAGTGTGTPRHGLARLLAGVGLTVLMLLLGLIAKTGPVASLDLQVDQHIAAHDRISALTALAREASTIATPEIIGMGPAPGHCPRVCPDSSLAVTSAT
jgi:hypothetical protein